MRGVAITLVATVLVVGCGSSDSTSSSSGSSGQFDVDAGAPKDTVDCTHPGAGAKQSNGRCACTPSHEVAGTWSGLYTCREGNTCVDRDKTETLRFEQNGSQVVAEAGPAGAPTFKLSGTLCGDILSWKGGPTDGKSDECGTIRFADATHYVKDSCYKTGGGCVPSFTSGCPDMTGQCTNTGAKAPAAATPIVKDICL